MASESQYMFDVQSNDTGLLYKYSAYLVTNKIVFEVNYWVRIFRFPMYTPITGGSPYYDAPRSLSASGLEMGQAVAVHL